MTGVVAAVAKARRQAAAGAGELAGRRGRTGRLFASPHPRLRRQARRRASAIWPGTGATRRC